MSMANHMRCGALLAAGLIGGFAVMVPPAIAADALGRLILTPEQRNQLELRRQSKVSEVAAVQTQAEEADEPVASYLNVQGQIVRSSGTQTIFINGMPYSGRESPKGTQLLIGKRLGEIVIVPAEGAPSVPVKVGQSLDKNSLSVGDAVSRAGTITVDRAAARPAPRNKAAP